MESRTVDLHVHSAWSDGELAPAELVERALGANLAAIALTDHDEVAGAAEAAEAASGRGLEVIGGVELTSYEGTVELHVVGLFVDPGVIAGYLEECKVQRRRRLVRMVERLREQGIAVDADGMLERSGAGSAGRPHLAAEMVRIGAVRNVAEAFKSYIGDSLPAYVPKRMAAPGEAIRVIHEAGGVAVLAHPGVTRHDELIPALADLGLDAIEVYYPRHSEPETAFYGNLARSRGLVAGGGSDFHGGIFGMNEIGKPPVPYSVLEGLREARDRRRGR